MLKTFFEITANHRVLFDGLAISQEHSLCQMYMNQYPVIFLSLKNVQGRTFADALGRIASLIAFECIRLSFLASNSKIDRDLQFEFAALKSQTATQRQLEKDISTKCHEAMTQIDEKNYKDAFLGSGIKQIRLYGITFWKKTCVAEHVPFQ